MEIRIKTIDFTARQPLQEFIREKVQGIARLKKELLSAEVTLKLDKHDARENKVCEIRLAVPGRDIFASRQSKTFEEATSLVIDAISRQVERAGDKHLRDKRS